jgi:fatty-acyl-CoA synthase
MAGTGETMTYGEMDRLANRIAHLLRARGLGVGDTFGVLMENHLQYLPIAWASQRAGTMLVPIPTRLTGPEVEYILRDSGSQLLVATSRFDEILRDIQRALPDLPILRVGGNDGPGEDWKALVAAQPDTLIDDPSAGLNMLYSSGTTGQPKGVRPPPPADADFKAASPLLALAVMGFGMPTDGSMVYLSPAPLYHAAPLNWCMAVHRLGGTVVVLEKFEPETALAAIEKYRITDSQWVPTHFVRMLKLPEDARTRYDLSSHQRALHAAAPCPVPVKRQMIEWWGPIVTEYYAGSESIGMTLIKAEDWLAHPGSVGKAIHGTVHICGPEGEEVGPGIDGTVYFENENLPSYHNDPDKTADAMHSSGWMTMGDIGHLDEDGYLYLTDRKSYMIISGGVNIYPQEIENHLVTHHKVMDAAVIGAPDPEFGEQVVAVVQPIDPGGTDPETLEAELRDFLAPKLSRIKMPKRFEFRLELPREANGKLYKRLLKEEFAKAAAPG